VNSTVITPQVPAKQWYRALGDRTIADAICDGIVQSARVIGLHRSSIREKEGLIFVHPMRVPDLSQRRGLVV